MTSDQQAYLAQIIVNGLHNSMLYAALAYGYVLAYAVTRRANLAHGAVFAFSGQVLLLGANLGYGALWMTLPESLAFGAGASIVLTAIALAVLSAVVIPRFVGLSPNMMIAATLALAIVIMEATRIGADARDYWLPPILPDRILLQLAEPRPSMTVLQVINCVLLLILLSSSEWLLTFTHFGRNLRAVADDTLAASLCGVNVQAVIRGAVMAGGGIAAFAGVLAVLYFGSMSFGAGLTYGLKVLFIASAGGFSRPLYAAAGAFLYGEAESLWDGYFPIAIRDPVFFASLAALLCLRVENRLEASERF